MSDHMDAKMKRRFVLKRTADGLWSVVDRWTVFGQRHVDTRGVFLFRRDAVAFRDLLRQQQAKWERSDALRRRIARNSDAD